jgi:hypothetical protein
MFPPYFFQKHKDISLFPLFYLKIIGSLEWNKIYRTNYKCNPSLVKIYIQYIGRLSFVSHRWDINAERETTVQLFDTVSIYLLPGGCIYTHTAEGPAVCRRIIDDRGDLRCPQDLQWILRRRFTFISDRMLLFSEMSYTFRSPLEEGDSFQPPSLKRDRKIRNKIKTEGVKRSSCQGKRSSQVVTFDLIKLEGQWHWVRDRNRQRNVTLSNHFSRFSYMVCSNIYYSE